MKHNLLMHLKDSITFPSVVSSVLDKAGNNIIFKRLHGKYILMRHRIDQNKSVFNHKCYRK